MTRNLSVFLILAFTQITGWGVVGVLPVLASSIAADLHIALPTVFLGTAVMFATMGLVAPVIGRGFERFGAKKVMAAGAALLGIGLASLSVTKSLPIYLTAWGALGIAGAMFLTTAAYVYLADFAEERARGLIGSLMLGHGPCRKRLLALDRVFGTHRRLACHDSNLCWRYDPDHHAASFIGNSRGQEHPQKRGC
ncbi:MFS transporter [Rhizobium leguminosarum]